MEIPTQEEKDYFLSLVNEVFEKTKLDFHLLHTPTYKISNWYYDNTKLFPKKVKVDFGLSKFVLFSKEKNPIAKKYVVKLPMLCWEKINEKGFVTRVDSIDYCNIEKSIFDLAIEEGQSNFLAEIWNIGTIKDVPIYLMERADCSESKLWKTPLTVFDDFSELGLIYKSFSTFYGEKVFEKFYDFCYNEDINDFHSGNIGFIGNRPVMIDYSGI